MRDKPFKANTLDLIIDANFLEEWAFFKPRRIFDEVAERQHRAVPPIADKRWHIQLGRSIRTRTKAGSLNVRSFGHSQNLPKADRLLRGDGKEEFHGDEGEGQAKIARPEGSRHRFTRGTSFPPFLSR